MKHSLLGGAATSAFAHLLGLGRTAGARAEDDDDDRKEDAARADAEDDGDDDDKKDSKKSKKAKADDPDHGDDDDDDKESARADAEDDGDDDDKKDSKKSKKAKADMDDDECDDEDDDDQAKGRKAERARWAKVLKSPAAANGRVAAACEMLANTSMSAGAVIATLGALPVASGRTGLQERMSAVRTPNIGSGGSEADKPGLAAQIVAAGKKRRGEKA